jgi:hypothetical protein
MSTAPHPWLEALIAWATPEASKADLLDARKAWFQRTGEVFEEDRQLELRMQGFLEHYTCGRVAPHLGLTPARARYEHALRAEGPEQAAGFRALTETIHGLFEVRRLSKGEVRVRGLFSGLTWDVTERRQMMGLRVGDVLEARLIPFGEQVHFAPAYCFHPHEAARLIKARAERLREVGGDEGDFIAECAQRSLKVDRYRQISVEKIYDFDARKI